MAGKKGRSGRQPEAPKNYDQDFKDEVIKIIKNLELKHKRPFLEQIFNMAYEKGTQDSVKASLFKTYSEIFATRKTENKADINLDMMPKIYIPKMDDDE